MPAPNPLPVSEQFTEDDWKELVSSAQPGGGNAFTRHTAEATLVGLVPFNKLLGLARYALGWNYCNGSTLQRIAPIAHPLYTNLNCTGFSELPYVPGIENQTGTVIPSSGDSNLFLEAKEPLYAGVVPLRGYSSYRKSRVTMRFGTLPFNLYDDDDLTTLFAGKEENRWTEIQTQPRMDILSVDGASLTFVESPAAGTVPGKVGQVLVKSDVQVIWHDVPKTWLFTDNEPVNIMAALGTVNSDTFFNYVPGTLLLVGARLTRNMWSFAAGGEDFFEYDVELLMSFFDPPTGAASPITHGHNLQPWRSPLPADKAASGKWFLATWTGDTPASGGRTLLQSSAFSDIFTNAGS